MLDTSISSVAMNKLLFTLDNGVKVYSSQVALEAIRSQGAGGQNVNKLATAIQLRVNLYQLALPRGMLLRILSSGDSRITVAGELVIKAQEFRTQERNRVAAIERLREWLGQYVKDPIKRKPTRPSRASVKRRLNTKSHRSKIKTLRKPFTD